MRPEYDFSRRLFKYEKGGVPARMRMDWAFDIRQADGARRWVMSAER
jgi:hypothetical protein